MAFFFTPVLIWVYFEPNFFLYVPKRSIERVVKLGYGNPLLSPPGGSFISNAFERGGLFGTWGLHI